MYLCLSSGSNPRYREDVLRALAIPSGTDVQFRYRVRWLSPKTVENLDKIAKDQPRALIAYIDQADPQQTPTVVPCRFARIVEAETHGTTVSLTLRVSGFAYAADLSAANAALRKAAPGVPAWANGKLVGYWWTDAAELPGIIVERTDLTHWELIVEQLFKHAEFATEQLFYVVEGIFNKDRRFVPYTDGRLLIAGGVSEYELQVYHYHPKTPPSTPLFFRVASNSALIRFSTGTVAAIDSPYDMKRFRFHADPSLGDEGTVVSIRTSSEETSDTIAGLGLDLAVKIKGDRLRYAGFGALIGVALAFPHISTALTAPNVSDERRILLVGVALVAGLVAGQIAAFGLKKL